MCPRADETHIPACPEQVPAGTSLILGTRARSDEPASGKLEILCPFGITRSVGRIADGSAYTLLVPGSFLRCFRSGSKK
ncbi:MAG: hypothetical protein ACRECH_10945 [Nitrososphaerales archaeon]